MLLETLVMNLFCLAFRQITKKLYIFKFLERLGNFFVGFLHHQRSETFPTVQTLMKLFLKIYLSKRKNICPCFLVIWKVLFRFYFFFEIGLELIIKKGYWSINDFYCLIFLTIYFEIKVNFHFFTRAYAIWWKSGVWLSIEDK